MPTCYRLNQAVDEGVCSETHIAKEPRSWNRAHAASLKLLSMKSTIEMETSPARSLAGVRMPVHKAVKPVNLICVAPQAREVYLTGDFNQWDPHSHAMRRQADGPWVIQVSLSQGYQRYLFLVDGTPTLDPKAYGTTYDDFGQKVSLLAVS